jgi:hypothetical protein
MWLPWNIALWCAAFLGLPGFLLRRHATRPAATWLGVVRESALLFALYAAWRWLGNIQIMGTERAASRGRSVWQLERWLHLPNEATLQDWCRHATWLLRAADVYYIVAHVVPLGLFLVWLYLRHRDSYAGWRNVLAFVSISCLLIQLVPVAPPRMYADLGFIDTGARFGPRVYDPAGAGLAGQLAAMPSLHVGWAVVIGAGAVQAGVGRWRWLVLAHPVLTMLAVTLTGYHWALDGLVAAGLVGLGVAVGAGLRRIFTQPAAMGHGNVMRRSRRATKLPPSTDWSTEAGDP